MELEPQTADMQAYLACTDIVDFEADNVSVLAQSLGALYPDPQALARAAYTFVRDRICHSADIDDPQMVTCTAAEVLHYGEGICYAKSHLLAALLRFHGIPCGFCYQILRQSGEASKLCLHALNAVCLNGRWSRVDARGNKPGVNARFELGAEKLAFAVEAAKGERDIPVIYAEPSPRAVRALIQNKSFAELWANLPESP